MPVSIYSRYHGLDTINDSGRVGLEQRTILPTEQYADSLIHHLIGSETLDQLAARYYGREDLWWRIADANPTKFPLDWQPGDKIIVPPIRVATLTPRR